MANQIKIDKVKNIEQKFKDSSAIYFTNYSGMSVLQATELRNKFTENNVDFIVTKNTLTKLGAKNAGFKEGLFDDILQGQIAIAYSENDPAAPAKVIKDFSKDNECIDVVGLLIDGELFDPEKYKELADLPSKDELITKFVVGLNFPMTSLAICLKSSMVNVVNVLTALKDQKN